MEKMFSLNCFGQSLDLNSVSSVFPCTERRHTKFIQSPFVRHFPFTYVFYGLFSPHGYMKPIQGAWKTSYLACGASGSHRIHEVQSSFSSKSSSLFRSERRCFGGRGLAQKPCGRQAVAVIINQLCEDANVQPCLL